MISKYIRKQTLNKERLMRMQPYSWQIKIRMGYKTEGIRPTQNSCHVTVTLSQALSTPSRSMAVTRRCCWCPSDGRVNALSLPHCEGKHGKLTVMQALSWHTIHYSQFFRTKNLLPGLSNKNHPLISIAGDSTTTRSRCSHNRKTTRVLHNKLHE